MPPNPDPADESSGSKLKGLKEAYPQTTPETSSIIRFFNEASAQLFCSLGTDSSASMLSFQEIAQWFILLLDKTDHRRNIS